MDGEISSNVSNLTFSIGSLELECIHYVALCLYIVYGLVSILGNVILIAAMVRAKLLQTGGYLTLAHFSFTDVITGVSTILFLPMTILVHKHLIPDFIPGIFLTYGAFSRKVFMAFMAGIMFWSILFPFSARRKLCIGWYRKVLALLWFVSCLASLPYWIANGHYIDFRNYRWGMNNRNYAPIYGLAFNVAVTVLILLVYPICFGQILKSNYHRREMQTGSVSGTLNLITHRDKILLLLFALNSAIFVLYWIPIYLCEFFELQIPYYSLLKETMRGILISYTPFAYCIIHSEIRDAVVCLFLCRKFTERKSGVSAVCVSHIVPDGQ